MSGIVRVFQLGWRHRVVQAAAAYVAVAWALFQVAIAIEQTWDLPFWVDQATMVALVLLFPPAMLVVWAVRSGPATTPQSFVAAPDLPPPAPAKGPATLAILPFANFSREPEDEIFADGIVEDLISGLSLNTALRVISRSSTFAYKGASPDVRAVARDLGVRFVLEGSVRRMGEEVRVTAQLIEAESGGHLWAEQYERPLDELFDLQDELVHCIAAALGDAISRAELTRARRNPASVSAWEEAMRALIAQERSTLANIPVALKHARRAVEIDPEFALGYARLAVSLATRAQLTGGAAADADREEANRHIDHALKLSPHDPKVLAAACSAMSFTGRADDAIRHGLRAIEINPNDAASYGSLANAYFRAGRFAEALPHYEHEEDLAPRSVFLNSRYIFRALTYLMLGDPEKAEANFRRATELDPAFEAAWAGLAIVRALRSDKRAAADAIRRLRALNPKAGLEEWTRVIQTNVPQAQADMAAAAFKLAWDTAEQHPG